MTVLTGRRRWGYKSSAFKRGAIALQEGVFQNEGKYPSLPSGDGGPTLTFESVAFSDGTTISLDPTDVVVFVGPNNAGKSAALRDLENFVGPPFQGTVVKSAKLRRVGTPDKLIDFIRKHADKTGSDPNATFEGDGFMISANPEHIDEFWSGDHIRDLRDFFCRRLSAESRIKDSDPADAISFPRRYTNHPIQSLYLNDLLEHRISGYFRRAFGEDLIVFRMGGRTCPLLVGVRPAPSPQEDRVSRSYNERLLRSTVPLEQQGDGMRSFASVIIHLLAPQTPSILIIDEPEAYLHPPQARLLGEIIATERPDRIQLFIATHSSDVLEGLLNVAPERLRVVRFERKLNMNINSVTELNKARAKEISADPLIKYSSVLSGVFHKRVVIAEADADCMFYSALSSLPQVHGDQQMDVLFVHANGKHRMPALARALVDLKVRVDVIADMDILQEEEFFRRLILSLGGDWSKFEQKARCVRKAIEQRKATRTSKEIVGEVSQILEKAPKNGEFPGSLKKQIEESLKDLSPWSMLKKTGRTAIPRGQPSSTYSELEGLCADIGLWIVPVGELEGFCMEVGKHGPAWVQQVFEQFNPKESPELEAARGFVGRVLRAPRPT